MTPEEHAAVCTRIDEIAKEHDRKSGTDLDEPHPAAEGAKLVLEKIYRNIPIPECSATEFGGLQMVWNLSRKGKPTSGSAAPLIGDFTILVEQDGSCEYVTNIDGVCPRVLGGFTPYPWIVSTINHIMTE